MSTSLCQTNIPKERPNIDDLVEFVKTNKPVVIMLDRVRGYKMPIINGNIVPIVHIACWNYQDISGWVLCESLTDVVFEWPFPNIGTVSVYVFPEYQIIDMCGNIISSIRIGTKMTCQEFGLDITNTNRTESEINTCKEQADKYILYHICQTKNTSETIVDAMVMKYLTDGHINNFNKSTMLEIIKKSEFNEASRISGTLYTIVYNNKQIANYYFTAEFVAGCWLPDIQVQEYHFADQEFVHDKHINILILHDKNQHVQLLRTISALSIIHTPAIYCEYILLQLFDRLNESYFRKEPKIFNKTGIHNLKKIISVGIFYIINDTNRIFNYLMQNYGKFSPLQNSQYFDREEWSKFSDKQLIQLIEKDETFYFNVLCRSGIFKPEFFRVMCVTHGKCYPLYPKYFAEAIRLNSKCAADILHYYKRKNEPVPQELVRQIVTADWTYLASVPQTVELCITAAEINADAVFLIEDSHIKEAVLAHLARQSPRQVAQITNLEIRNQIGQRITHETRDTTQYTTDQFFRYITAKLDAMHTTINNIAMR